MGAKRPVFVAFSGGRDSSALLALAVRVAHRSGAALPVPLIMRWDHESMREDVEHQVELLDQLGLRPEIISARPEHRELLGPWAQEGLEANGLTWPWLLHWSRALNEVAQGGVLVDGEGGDQLFGVTRSRIMHHLRAARRRPAAVLGEILFYLGPWSLRLHLNARSHRDIDWFTPEGRSKVLRLALEDMTFTPFRADSALLAVAGSRSTRLGLATATAHARTWDVQLVSPLLEPRFVTALAGEAGTLGWSSRTAAMHDLFGDLLPAHFLRRVSKADFTELTWGPQTRSWLRSWNGLAGVNSRWVDRDRLRAAWASHHPHATTALMAQTAWLEQELGRVATS